MLAKPIFYKKKSRRKGRMWANNKTNREVYVCAGSSRVGVKWKLWKMTIRREKDGMTRWDSAT